jgi:plasmid maintenance system antidote protein VapI
MNALAHLLQDKGLTAAELARRIDRKKSYLSHVIAGRKKLGRPTAIAIYRETAVKIGPIANMSDSDIDVLERLGGEIV